MEKLSEDTLHHIERRWSKYRKASKKPGQTFELRVRKGQPVIPLGSMVDCLFMISQGAVRMVPSEGAQAVPLNTLFYGIPEKDLPIIGARYYFTRRPSKFTYLAESDCVVHPIESDLIVDIGTISELRHDGQISVLTRETILNSDMSEHYVWRAAAALGLPETVIDGEFALLSVCEDIRAFEPQFRLKRVVDDLFEELLELRREKAEEMGIDPSIFVGAST